jgi:hypothetical protein
MVGHIHKSLAGFFNNGTKTSILQICKIADGGGSLRNLELFL